MDETKEKRHRSANLTDEIVEQALYAAKGVQAIAADMLDVRRSTINNRVTKSQMLQDVIQDCLEIRLDKGEYALSHLIEDENNLGAICFFLKTKGKHRGYAQADENSQIDLDKIRAFVEYFDGRKEARERYLSPNPEIALELSEEASDSHIDQACDASQTPPESPLIQ